MHRLSGFDASLLYLESSSQPMNTCTLMELDTSTMTEGYAFDVFRSKLSVLIPALPEFRMKLADSRMNLDTPVWVEDPNFELDQHLHRVAWPAPCGRRELSEVAGRLVAGLMDRDRPLWDMWVIDDASPTDPTGGGRVAVMLRIHHALVDAVTAGNLMARLCSTEIAPEAPAPAEGVGTVSKRAIIFDGMRGFASRPRHLVSEVLPASVSAIRKTLRRAADGRAMPSPMTAPRTPFNGNITQDRTVAYTQLELDDVKAIKSAFDVKLNDVMLALLAGALRRYLTDRAALPQASLVAMMPISVFDSDRSSRNQMSAMFSRLFTHIAEPADRLKAIAEATSTAKQHSSELGATLLQDWTQHAPGSLAMIMRLYRWSGLSARRPAYNVSLSNVHGHEVQCYLLGAAITGRYPLGPLLNGVGLNVSVVSLNGKLDVGLVACPQLLPDLWDLADNLHIALKELLEATT
ncbi:wax ester/triacylglycerol synthase family O-acyltransferase [Mycobacterium avium subsp. hominissuis]|uniref:WS/DGAT/MGAT family O-acyltransferase n=1 Tax=Mycobacterium avium TaxID=1764 RepID=UPI000392592D|nr:wax ester/triacylglycerol synthase family O-acyltransferase [Mycobacterium avium]APA74580.1 wax ester/triacylglycerol synthase family O-acyltransferase [Mycobacterium avium subsp. hominissuis]ATO61546.2 wax ester/triacylglycerol synthase family O-acyltransferase [Mycobacterium avium subsp. hominissuis]ATO66099.1 wax ester/triacylglycerol synthase family O-acyltransferase [Mycobacterium avium subsp. hominissuis]ATO70683.1 wax ester/triacylglycerol synthase family O-acyltransferase [Mycobacter